MKCSVKYSKKNSNKDLIKIILSLSLCLWLRVCVLVIANDNGSGRLFIDKIERTMKVDIL